MPLCHCNCRCSCTVAALIVSAILGVLAAFLQITGVITATPVFLWVALGIAVVYLCVQAVAASLAGILGAVLLFFQGFTLISTACYVRTLTGSDG